MYSIDYMWKLLINNISNIKYLTVLIKIFTILIFVFSKSA